MRSSGFGRRKDIFAVLACLVSSTDTVIGHYAVQSHPNKSIKCCKPQYQHCQQSYNSAHVQSCVLMLLCKKLHHCLHTACSSHGA